MIVQSVKSAPAARPPLAANYDDDVFKNLARVSLDNIGDAEPLPRPMGGNIAHDIIRLGHPPFRFAAFAVLVAQLRQWKTPLMEQARS